MTFSSLLGILAGLALVLGLIALLVRPLRAFSMRAGLRREGAGLEVISRVALAPRQGLAEVRFGNRTALVSYGEGGVRLVLEDADEGIETGQEGGDDVAEVDDRFLPIPRRPTKDRFSKVARSVGLSLLFAGALQLSLVDGAAASQSLIPDVEGSGAAPAGDPDPAETLSALGQSFRSVEVQLGEGENALRLGGPVGTVILIGFLTLLPTVVLLMTGFTRILVVLHLLRQALGTQAAPPAHLLAAMALLLTGFVMAPTLGEVNRTALAPWVAGEMDEGQMLKAASVPFRGFMLTATREQDLETFIGIHGGPPPATVDDVPLVVVTSAFVTSELRSAFQMGFALFLPFVVIDLVVASVLMSMGMFMLPPVMVSLPFKLLLFVMVDGWALVVGGLVRSFQGG